MFKFIPLSLAAISPVGMGLVILLLSSQGGLRKTLAYLIAKALAFTIWGIVFLNLSITSDRLRPSETSRSSPTIQTFLGILLLVIAIRIFITEQDPDALPLKWTILIEKFSAKALFFLNFFLSLFQIRFVLLIMVGAEMINSARLSESGTFLGSLILLFILLWPQLLPLGIFLALRDRSEKALKSLDIWLTNNSRLMNAGLLGFVGIVLVWGGLIDLASR